MLKIAVSLVGASKGLRMKIKELLEASWYDLITQARSAAKQKGSSNIYQQQHTALVNQVIADLQRRDPAQAKAFSDIVTSYIDNPSAENIDLMSDMISALYVDREKQKKIAAAIDYETRKQEMQPAQTAGNIAKAMVKKGFADLIKPPPPPAATVAPDEKERDPNAVPLYTVTAPGGVKVTKYSDGLWIDDNDEYIGDPADIAQLEKLATAQKYSKGAAIPKSQMPKPTWRSEQDAARRAALMKRPGKLNPGRK